VDVVKKIDSRSQVKEVSDRYIWVEFPSLLGGTDDVEFLLLPEEKLVAYRSCSRNVNYIYPIQTPLGDFGANLKRLNQIRSELGWIDTSDMDF